MVSCCTALKNIGNISSRCVLTGGLRSVRNYSFKDPLKDIIRDKIPARLEEFKKFKKENSSKEIGNVTVGHVLTGMRGLKAMTYETSVLDPEEGITFRGHSIPEASKILPKAKEEVLPEGIFWLLVTGDVPTKEQVEWLSSEWAKRAKIPMKIANLIDSFPESVHPMAQFSAALSLMSYHSKFAKHYGKNIPRGHMWEYIYEDCMDLIASMPLLAARIYRNIYHDGHICSYDKSMDWGYNYAKMLGFDDPKFHEFMRLYLFIHCDHEGGNVSAHTNKLVASAHSDPYLSFAAALNGLAGPLHGRANQQVSQWIDQIVDTLGFDASDEELKNYCINWLKKDVIPGYGHAVLRKTDPRFTVQLEFAEKHLPGNELVDVVKRVYKIVPDILKGLGKVKNPYPNVDCISGSVLFSLGLTERSYYTVPFGVSRAIGCCSALIWDRIFELPIERPKSLSFDCLKNLVKDN